MARKIRHYKSSYSRRRSRTKRIVGTIVFIILALVLVVVGYSIGGTVMDYLQNKKDDNSSSVWSPNSDYSSMPQNSETNNSTSQDESEPEPVKIDTDSTYYLPELAILSAQTLEEELDKAVSLKVDSVAITLKNDVNGLLYASENLAPPEQRELKLSQIISAVKQRSLKPIAIISTLKDHISMGSIPDLNYHFSDGSSTWLDNSPDQGGKPWISPFKSATVDFFKTISKEIFEAGFEEIYYTNLIFPNFMDYDYTVLADIGDSEKRISALKTISSAISGEFGDKKALAQVNAEELINDGNAYLGSAEILSKGMIENIDIALRIEPSLCGKTVNRKDGQTETMPTSYYDMVKRVSDEALKAVSKDRLQLVVSKGDLSDAEIQELNKEFNVSYIV